MKMNRFLPVLKVRAFLMVALAAGGLLARAQSVYENYTFVTIAGVPESGPGRLDGPGPVARLRSPQGIACDASGNIYVADTFNHTIRKILPNGMVSTLAGLGGQAGTNDGVGVFARFNTPTDLVLDGSGNLFVADFNNHTIRKITPAGVVTTYAGGAGVQGVANGTAALARFNRPSSVAIDSSNNIYVADTYNHAIRKITPGGLVTTLAGRPQVAGALNGVGVNARFFYPFGVAVDLNDNIYVADTYNQVIRKVTPAGVVSTLAGTFGQVGGDDGNSTTGKFSFPLGVRTDAAGNVYVADYEGATIRKVSPNGDVLTLAGSWGNSGTADGTNSTARFNHPAAVALDGNTNIYVADFLNHSIRKLTPQGVVTTIAGHARDLGAADGVAINARFNFPSDVAVDAAKNVYVADVNNHTIRKITPAGIVTTLAGSAGNSGTNNGTGGDARFNRPIGIAIDATGSNLYVTDSDNYTIRKVTTNGVVTALAGLPGTSGTNDGTGDVARFNRPYGIAVGPSGDLYIGDTGNHTVRKVTLGGTVTTVAGIPGVIGSDNGPSNAAKFNFPEGVDLDAAGNIYVVDDGNSVIRKITPAGDVSTFAGVVTNTGSADGIGTAAKFSFPFGIAVDQNGNVYVGDTVNQAIRKITPAGVVTTIAGAIRVSGGVEGTGAEAVFNSPEGVAVDNDGVVYMVDTANHTIRKGYPALPDKAVIDFVSAPAGTPRQLSISGQTTTSWSWNFTRYPANSATVFSAPTIPNPTFTPDVNDLYEVRLRGTDSQGRVAISTVAAVNDSTAPTVKIVTPTSGQRWSNAVFNVTGTASDNTVIAGVWYQLNGGAWAQATGTASWNTSVTLTAGTNTINAYAKDIAGNVSATNSVKVIFVVTLPIAVETRGSGTVAVNYNGKALEVGKDYFMTATALRGFRFTKWTDGATNFLTASNKYTFKMQTNLTLLAHFVEALNPTLVVTAPRAGIRWSNAVFTATGTARDNLQVAGVWYQLNSDAWTLASTTNGWTNWMVDLPLRSNSNTLKVYAEDVAGNRSITNTTTFTYIVSDRLTLLTTGLGRLSPSYSNAVLAIGGRYTMTAIPSPGFIFSNWVGSVIAEKAALTFTMQSNFVLQANFVTNPFPRNIGTYQGLFYDTNEVAHESSGSFSATVTSLGAFTAKIQMAGKVYAYAGQFSAGGLASNSIARVGQSQLTVMCQLDLNGGDIITGQVMDTNWVAELTAKRPIYSKTNPAPQAGKYTLVLPGGQNAATEPAGESYSTVTVDTLGNVTMTATLADGTKILPRTIMSKDSQAPLYSPLYVTKGALLGWLTFSNQPNTDISGAVSWIKQPTVPAAKFYPAGFTNVTEAIGSKWNFTNGVPILNWTTGSVWFANGNIAPFTNGVALATNKFTNLSTNKLTITPVTLTGQFSGTVVNPANNKLIIIGGVFLQKQNVAYGSFLGTNQVGRLFMGP